MTRDLYLGGGGGGGARTVKIQRILAVIVVFFRSRQTEHNCNETRPDQQ